MNLYWVDGFSATSYKKVRVVLDDVFRKGCFPCLAERGKYLRCSTKVAEQYCLKKLLKVAFLFDPLSPQNCSIETTRFEIKILK